MPSTTAVRKTKAVPLTVAFALPELAKGETYAGILLKDGKPAHHLVLLPGHTNANWKDAVAWAKKQGGELPTRKEQALLFANAAEQFESRWYWSGEQLAGGAGYAWGQGFGNGGQGNNHESGKALGRAVRRVPL